MIAFIEAVVYATGKPANPLEIQIPREAADRLPYDFDEAVPIKLRIDDSEYKTELRRKRVTWVSWKAVSQEGESRRLGEILAQKGFVGKERVILQIDGTVLTLLRQPHSQQLLR